MRILSILSLFLPIILMINMPDASAQSILGEPALSCYLNKSFTFEIYKDRLPLGNNLIMKIKHFRNDPELNQLMYFDTNTTVIDYGNVFMAIDNRGELGYFFLRVEKGVVPEGDLGNVTVTIDNSLVIDQDSLIYTAGHLAKLSHCTWR